jgi:hypothetical protein
MKELAKSIFETGIEEGSTRDMIVVAMVQAGITLNTAQIQYKELAAEAGMSSTRIGYRAEAVEYLDEIGLDITNDDQRSQARVMLQDKFGVATSTANDYIKLYADQVGIELPKSNFGSNPEDQDKIYSWISTNPDCSKQEFVAFMKVEMGRSSGSIDETYRGIVLARKLFADGVEFSGLLEDAA